MWGEVCLLNVLRLFLKRYASGECRGESLVLLANLASARVALVGIGCISCIDVPCQLRVASRVDTTA